jgi:hypothetical protein
MTMSPNTHCKLPLIINTVISRGQINHKKNSEAFGQETVQVDCYTT